MNRAEFIDKAGWNVGVAQAKAERWADQHPKKDYADQDLDALYWDDRSMRVGSLRNMGYTTKSYREIGGGEDNR